MAPGKILLVEDNPIVRLKTAVLLRSAGYTVFEAQNGGEGLEQAHRNLPDLLLLDVVLPDLNGLEVCRKLKAELPVFVVLLSSTMVSPDNQAAGLHAGADGYIARPVENGELLARVDSMLRIARAESGLRRAKEQLEERVNERTRELREANEALKKEVKTRRAAEEAQRRAASQLRSLSRQLLGAQEAERRAVARELHDEVGQMLTTTKILLETGLETGGATLAGRVSDALGIQEDLLDIVRRMSLDLRPQMLDDLGLVPALEWHFARLRRHTGLQVSFVAPQWAQRLAPELETAIFRIIQEALTNVCRHGDVSEAAVCLEATGDRLVLGISDRGRGFSSTEIAASTGLSAMRERVTLLDGHFGIETAPGAGTRLSIELPLAFV